MSRNVKEHATPAAAYEYAADKNPDGPWDSAGNVKLMVEIKGLEVYDLANGLFQFTGMKPRQMDWHLLWQGLGFSDGELTDQETDDLCERIGKVVQEHDLVKLLRDRIKVV